VGADELAGRVECLKPELFPLVEKRMGEFESAGGSGEERWFSELCFCILTANFTAEGGARIQKELAGGFLTLGRDELARRLSELGHRFPNARADFIVEARKHFGGLKKSVSSFPDGKSARLRLTEIKGLGMKEASHLLRNLGYKDVAIIDRHILNLLKENGMIEDKPLSPKRYVEIEKVLEDFGRRTGLDLARLDLYLWYLKTGKVLK
jgi:N-glycosylase/DNA lyase